MEKVVRYEDIVTNLRVLGIKEGDTLLVHSALSSMGKVDGGPATVIRALLDLLGEKKGTLVMSTLTMWDKADPEKHRRR